MRINAIYTAISGEVGGAIRQGEPCLIIRTQGCNMACSYCDASETQTMEGPGQEFTIESLLQIIKLDNFPVLLTGGEPLIQPDAKEFIQKCVDEEIIIQVETNGSVKIPPVDESVSFVVDCKFNDNCNVDILNDLTHNDWVKFVVSDWNEVEKARQIMIDFQNATCNWAISPVDDGDVIPDVLAKYLIEWKMPVVLNVQLHKYIGLP